MWLDRWMSEFISERCTLYELHMWTAVINSRKCLLVRDSLTKEASCKLPHLKVFHYVCMFRSWNPLFQIIRLEPCLAFNRCIVTIVKTMNSGLKHEIKENSLTLTSSLRSMFHCHRLVSSELSLKCGCELETASLTNN